MKVPEFYVLSSLDVAGKDVKGTISFNSAHEIFKGHFPGQPVVPGVCMVRIVKDVLEKITGDKLWLKESKQIKFLQLVRPDGLEPLNLELHLEMEEITYEVLAHLYGLNGIVFKFQGKFIPVSS